MRDPKERLVSAAPFRDRVVHHALCAVIVPFFERGFIANTFANRVGKGTHKAIRAYERYRDRRGNVLRADIFRYFPSIDHAILKAEFRRRIECERTLWLMDAIVEGSNPQEPIELHSPTPATPTRTTCAARSSKGHDTSRGQAMSDRPSFRQGKRIIIPAESNACCATGYNGRRLHFL